MADIRTLKLNLLADTANFRKGLNGARKASDSFAGQVGLGMRNAAVHVAALSASIYGIVKVSESFVQAAIEDEKSQRLLAKQLQNTTKATDAQIAATEEYITKTQNQYGIQDDKLRPAFGRLVRSTKDATEAQKYLNLALDISAATQKPLETVTAALSKTIDGSATSLAKLGVGIDSSVLKSGDLNLIFETLRSSFAGFAQIEADTVEGKMARLGVLFDDIKEKIGKAIIDKIILALPYIQDFAEAFAGTSKKSLAGAMSATAREAAGDTPGKNLADSILAVAEAFGTLFDAVTGSKSSDAATRLDAFATAVLHVADAINFAADAYKRLGDFVNSKKYQRTLDYFFGPKGTGFFEQFSYLAQALTGSRAGGGVVGGSGSYLVGERGPEIFTPNGSGGGRITPNGGMGGTTIIMNGIVDGESARRSIERLIQQSSRLSGAVNWSGALS
jgi:hypothetical protein